jgi:hypothetical protein
MATIQTSDQMRGILFRLNDETIVSLQVLGVNSLKSLSPGPDALAGENVESVVVVERTVTMTTGHYQVVFDLQRTGRLVWLDDARPYSANVGTPRPTVRLILANGHGLDLLEPAKTKRIAVTISARQRTGR